MQLRDLTGIGLSTIKNYETQQKEPGLVIVDRFLSVELFQKYTLWLMTGQIAPEAGQIAPKAVQEMTKVDDKTPTKKQTG